MSGREIKPLGRPKIQARPEPGPGRRSEHRVRAAGQALQLASDRMGMLRRNEADLLDGLAALAQPLDGGSRSASLGP